MNSERFNGQKTFTAMQLKADILNAMNKNTEADAVMKDAMTIATMNDIHQYGKSLLTAGKNEKAVEIFKLNREKNKDDKFTTFVGLARGYTATGNKKEAIKNWEIALKNIPENQKANTAAFQEELKKLKN